MRRLMRLLALMLSVILSGCAGGITLKPMWVPCPAKTIGVPVWSSDSKKLALVMSEPNNIYALNLIDVNRASITRVAEVQAGFSTLEWSQDGSQFLFATQSRTSGYEFFSLDENGAEDSIFQLAGYPSQFRWSPSGDQIALDVSVGNIKTDDDLWMINQEGQVQWKLSEYFSGFSWVSYIDWAPDGTNLAFAYSTANFQSYIGIISASGEKLTHLHLGEAVVSQIEWSPDGSRIALKATDAPTPLSLMVVRSDGTDLTILPSYPRFSSGAEGVDFVWLPDSASLIYLDKDNKIVKVSVDTLSQEIMASIPYTVYFAALSPDGTMITYFDIGLNGWPDLHLMNVDGTNHRQIFHNPGNDRCFQWPF